MTITIVILTTFALYRIAAGQPLANILAAVAVTGLYTLLDSSLRGLPVLAYLSSFAVLWLGFQVVMPAAEAPIRLRFYGNIPALQVGRFAVAMMPTGV